MKKLIIGIGLSLIALFPVVSGDIIGFEGVFEAGLADGAFGEWSKDTQYDYLEESRLFGFETTYVMTGGYVWLWGCIYLGGESTIQMKSVDGIGSGPFGLPGYDPMFTNYKFEVGLSFLDRFVLFISHDCSHPQFTYSPEYRVTALWGEGGVERIGVRFNANFGKVGVR